MRRFVFVYRGPSGPEEIAVELEPPRCELRRAGGSGERAELVELPDGRLSLLFENGLQICGRVLPAGAAEAEVITGESRRRIALADPLHDRLAHAAELGRPDAEDEEVLAQMPGRVIEVAVAEGENVAAGGLLLVLEAMKMQNEIRTERGGTVARLSVAAGEAVESGALLAVLRQLQT
jgi:biotin carboxyl carrier protein